MGEATITRYENNQIQDRAHDDILRKINDDPNWLLEILDKNKENISEKAFRKYMKEINWKYNQKQNQYRINAISAKYAIIEDVCYTGNSELRLDKVVELINYFAEKVNILHKVKLMKMQWYSDCLNYKRHNHSITGLAYKALCMGAVPEGYDQIIDLDGISYEEIWYSNDTSGFKFKPVSGFGTDTFIAKYKNQEFQADFVKNWLRNRSTIEFLGLWEKLNNPEFKLVEFNQFKNQAGSNSFVLSPQR